MSKLDELMPQIEKFSRDFIKIMTTAGQVPNLWSSNFCGVPYQLKESEYPKDPNGKPMFMIAQINFEEVPTLDPYPTKGILQFFIADDDMMGLELSDHTTQKGFKVIWIEDVVKDESLLKTREELLAERGELKYFGGNYGFKEANLKFTLDNMPPIEQDHFGAEAVNEALAGNLGLVDEYAESVSIYTGGHRIGGYAYFTQEDPRNYRSSNLQDLDCLLLQIDTDDNGEISPKIMWGDAGVANFFISKEDLVKRDFSKVAYNWDCY